MKNKRIKILFYIILTLGSLIMLVPFFWMISTSLKTGEATFILPPEWVPKKVTLENYIKLFQVMPMWKYFANSVFVSVVSTSLQVLISSMAGYAFARIEFKGKNIIFVLYLATLMVPAQVTYTPLFILMSRFGLANTYRALILPGIFKAFGVFLMRQFFMGIPRSLEEAAFMDGAGHVTIFFKIIFPLAKPAAATLFILEFMHSWNNFLWPLIITNGTDHMTLPLALSTLLGRWETDWNLLMAGTFVSVLPILIVYIFAQKYIIKGMSHTGLK